MNPSSIQPIGAIQQTDNNTSAKLTAQTETPVQIQPTATHPEKLQPEIKAETKPDQAGNLTDISLHFRVDDETNNVVIFLVDRKSKKVLRSIPASELRKMQISDLLKLTA